MKIILYSLRFLPKIGGRELVVYHLAKALGDLGENVRVVGPGEYWKSRNKRFGVNVHRYPRFARGSIESGRVHSYIREFELMCQLVLDARIWGADIIHAHTTYPAGYIAAHAMKRIPNCKLIITPHGEDIHTIPEIGHGMRLNPRLKPKIEYALEHANRITSISNGIESSLLDAGADPAKIIRVPNGVDIERFNGPSDLDVREWLNLPPDARLIITVGNYRPFRGHDVMVNAMIQILKKEPRARLIIVGADTDVLKPNINRLGLADKVILTGSISYPIRDFTPGASSNVKFPIDYVGSIFKSSNVYVSAGVSDTAEGLSLAVLEAQAAGLPLVATAISGNMDIVQDGKNGILVAPGNVDDLADGILHVLGNQELSVKMSEEARNVASKYHWKEIARQYLEIYKMA